MRDLGHCKMNPESIDLVDEFYDYSEQNLNFLQKQFDDLQVKKKGEIKQVIPKTVEEENEEEWEDCDTEDEMEEIEEEKREDSKGGEEDEQYVLIRGYWHPLKDKIVTKKFIRENLNMNDKEEVILPGGKILGHRKYTKYYKQNMVEVVRKKSEIIKALAYREMERANRSSNGTVAKYESVVKTLER